MRKTILILAVLAAAFIFLAAAPAQLCNDDELAFREVETLAKMVLGEAGNCPPNEQKLVIEVVFNRLKDPAFVREIGNSVTAQITAPGQFTGYNPKWGIQEDIYALCLTALSEWYAGTYEATLPDDVLFFYGDMAQNHFYNRDGEFYRYEGEIIK